MTPRQVLAVLQARWPWALAILVLSVAASTTISMTMLKRYTATAVVMLDARTPDQVSVGAPNSSLPGGYMATQMELLFSERVGRAVIRDLKLAGEPTLRSAWQKIDNGHGDFEAWLSEALAKSLVVKPAAVSNLLNIAYTADTAERAAVMANAYVKAYVETSLELRTERVRQFGGFFDARAQELRAELDRAQAKLSDYQQKNGILVGDDKLNVESTRLAELNTQLLLAQSAAADVAGRMRQAGRQTDQLQEVWKNPAVAALDADVTREEVRLREMRSRLGDSHPQLIEQDARLSELKAKLAAEKTRAVGYAGFDTNASQNRVAQISAAIETQRGKVLRMQAHREQYTALQREADRAQRDYEAMQQRVSLASIESQNTHTNVTVLKHASAPIAPSSPNLLKNIGASIAGGLLLGVGVVVGFELLDRRMRTVDDVNALKQPLLVSLPVAAHANRLANDTSRTRLMKERVLTGLPRPTPPQTT
jgi:succinoglycan biosynthesis transport protein ExoP